MKNIDLLNELKQELISNNSNPKVANWIISHLYKINNNLELTNILFNDVNLEIYDLAKHILNDYLFNGKPLARLTNKTFFYKNEFIVNDNVFCPRIETELLVDYLVKFVNNCSEYNFKILDLCCGTGVIGISLKLNSFKNIDLTLIDINQDAISNTLQNLNLYNLKAITINSNLFENLSNESKFNIIVCNPPYISKDYDIDSVIKHDPYEALFADNNGLYIYEKIINNLSNLFVNVNKYLIAFEIGINQENEIINMLLKYDPNIKIKIYRDYNNINRIIFGYKGYEF